MYIAKDKLLVSATFLGGNALSIIGNEKDRWGSTPIEKDAELSTSCDSRTLLAAFTEEEGDAGKFLKLRRFKNLSASASEPSVLRYGDYTFLGFKTSCCKLRDGGKTVVVTVPEGEISANLTSPADKECLEDGLYLLIKSESAPVPTEKGAKLSDCSIQVMIKNPSDKKVGIPIEGDEIELI